MQILVRLPNHLMLGHKKQHVSFQGLAVSTLSSSTKRELLFCLINGSYYMNGDRVKRTTAM